MCCCGRRLARVVGSSRPGAADRAQPGARLERQAGRCRDGGCPDRPGRDGHAARVPLAGRDPEPLRQPDEPVLAARRRRGGRRYGTCSSPSACTSSCCGVTCGRAGRVADQDGLRTGPGGAADAVHERPAAGPSAAATAGRGSCACGLVQRDEGAGVVHLAAAARRRRRPLPPLPAPDGTAPGSTCRRGRGRSRRRCRARRGSAAGREPARTGGASRPRAISAAKRAARLTACTARPRGAANSTSQCPCTRSSRVTRLSCGTPASPARSGRWPRTPAPCRWCRRSRARTRAAPVIRTRRGCAGHPWP